MVVSFRKFIDLKKDRNLSLLTKTRKKTFKRFFAQSVSAFIDFLCISIVSFSSFSMKKRENFPNFFSGIKNARVFFCQIHRHQTANTTTKLSPYGHSKGEKKRRTKNFLQKVSMTRLHSRQLCDLFSAEYFETKSISITTRIRWTFSYFCLLSHIHQ